MKLAAVALLGALVVLASTTEVAGNFWCLLTGRGFFIPAESSVFTFRVTRENDGSGEWWLYGEDRRNFYALVPDDAAYLVFARRDLPRCPAFTPFDHATWCPGSTVRVATE